MFNKFLYTSIFLLLMPQFAHTQEKFAVYFDSNQYKLTELEQLNLQKWIAENPKIKVVAINGFTDKDGSLELNDTLAQNRVDFVFNFIAKKVAIRSDYKSRSFGEIHSQKGNKSENRRVEIYYLAEKDLARENEILGIKEQDYKNENIKKIRYPDVFQVKNPNGTIAEFTLDTVFMQKVTIAKQGEKLKLDNLNFQFNTFAITNESRGKLYELLLVMMQNSKLKIEVQGHICCNNSRKESLSTQRAKAIKGFLTSQGIAENRITYRGFGSTQPLYPLPEKNEKERALNRRVEILITER